MSDHSLLRDAMVYLASAIVCVPIAKRARLGSVLGYLVAGCAIGPFGLKLFRDYAFAFEATSVLILVAMVGAIVLARKERP